MHRGGGPDAGDYFLSFDNKSNCETLCKSAMRLGFSSLCNACGGPNPADPRYFKCWTRILQTLWTVFECSSCRSREPINSIRICQRRMWRTGDPAWVHPFLYSFQLNFLKFRIHTKNLYSWRPGRRYPTLEKFCNFTINFHVKMNLSTCFLLLISTKFPSLTNSLKIYFDLRKKIYLGFFFLMNQTEVNNSIYFHFHILPISIKI